MIRPNRHNPTVGDHAPPGRNAGFSLVELILVVLIIAIIAGLAVPMFGTQSATVLREAAKMLAADIAFAQNESITHGHDPRMVIFDTTHHSYRIAPVSDPDATIEHPVSKQPFQVQFGHGRASHLAGVTIQSLSMNGDPQMTPDRFAFGIWGQTDQATHPTITLAADGMTITVTVHASTGQTTISDLQ